MKALHRIGQWLAEKNAPPVVYQTDRETDCVRQVFHDVGLPVDQFSREFDLEDRAKVFDVLILAARRLGLNHELRTVGDVIDWLKDAPKAVAL